MSTLDPTLQKPGLPPIGTRVRHDRFGYGTVKTHDNYVDKDTGKRVQLNRVGITFDRHGFIVNPAYFNVENVRVIKPQA